MSKIVQPLCTESIQLYQNSKKLYFEGIYRLIFTHLTSQYTNTLGIQTLEIVPIVSRDFRLNYAIRTAGTDKSTQLVAVNAHSRSNYPHTPGAKTTRRQTWAG